MVNVDLRGQHVRGVHSLSCCIHVLRHGSLYFPEIFSSYSDAASHSSGRMLVFAAEEWSAHRPEWQDPDNIIILWWWNNAFVFENLVPLKRKAAFALWYMESVGPLESLCENQRKIFSGFMKYLMIPDVVVVGSPSAAEAIRPYCHKSAYAPIGYDSRFMGMPDWSATKEHDFGCCAPRAGRRNWIVPALKRRLGKKILGIEGVWKTNLRKIYNKCRAILYIAHSDEPSFPGLRIWEAVATSAALVTEKRDVWPAVPGRHYVEVSEAKKDDLEGFADRVELALELPLLEIARAANSELSAYTPERATQYIVEAMTYGF